MKKSTVLFLLPVYPLEANRKARTPPSGVLQLASLLIEGGYGVDVVDPLLEQMDIDNVKSFLFKKDFDILGMSGFSANYWFVKEISAFLRKAKPRVPIMAGGPVASASPEHLLKFTEVDACALGEGEPIILKLVSGLLEGSGLSDIPSIAFKDPETKEITVSKTILRTENLDNLPLPAYQLVDLKKYSSNRRRPSNIDSYLTEKGIDKDEVSPVMPVQTQRGCPYACHFCSKNYGKRLIRHSVDYVINYLGRLNEQYGYNNFKFVDDAFNIPNSWVFEFCEKIIASGKRYFFWPSGNRANYITDDLVRTMRKAGFYQISIGIESFNQKVLDEMNKGLKLEDLLRALDILTRHGMLPKTECVLQFGWPSDSIETMKRNIKNIHRYGFDKVGFFFPCPFPNTVLYDMAFNARKISDLESHLMNLAAHNLNRLLVNISRFSDRELLNIVRQARAEVKLNRLLGSKNYLAYLYQMLGYKAQDIVRADSSAYKFLRSLSRRIKK